ncbi:MAG: ATP-binding cassette domain-containing protein, partial [Bdellovibrionaceae bacterium]|nr:ATP-binding cassette domain-containing protein [Pseudobdellovibrionaceae bacterium]
VYSWQIESAEWSFERMLVISGPSGSGKSTWFRTLVGFQEAGPKFRWYFNKQWMNESPIPPNIGAVFQQPLLFDTLSVGENIYLASLKHKVPKTEQRQLVHRLGLWERLSVPASQLSGGEKKRLSIAQMILQRPKLCLLDEPFNGLDSNTLENTKALIWDYLIAENAASVLITHRPEDYAGWPVTISPWPPPTFQSLDSSSDANTNTKV